MLFFFLFVAAANAATLVPIDQSVVNVKSERNGQDYSYSIHESKNIAVEPVIHTIHHTIPAVPAIPAVPLVKTTQEIHHVEQRLSDQPHHEKEQKENIQSHVKSHVDSKIQPHVDVRSHHQVEVKQPQGKAYQELTYTSLPLIQYPTFYNLLPNSYPYAYTYPYSYHYNYNLLPLRID